jgi:hypothetical protein
VVRVELAERILQAVAKHERSYFHLLFTGDESWLFYAHNHRTMCVPPRDDVDEIERPSHFQQKTMRTICFNGTRAHKIPIPPAGQKMNSRCFMECVLLLLREVCSPEGGKSHKRRGMLHFDNAPIHNAEEVHAYLTDLGFTTMEQPRDGPDLARCDFFLFGAIKENVSG